MAQMAARFESNRMKNMDHSQSERLTSAEQQTERNQDKHRKQLERVRTLRLAQSELMAKLE